MQLNCTARVATRKNSEFRSDSGTPRTASSKGWKFDGSPAVVEFVGSPASGRAAAPALGVIARGGLSCPAMLDVVGRSERACDSSKEVIRGFPRGRASQRG